MKVLDCRGLACPKPVIMAKKELENSEIEEFEVIVDNEAAKINVSKFATSAGASFLVKEEEKGIYHITLKKLEATETEAGCEILNFEGDKNIVILVSNDKLGLGDDKLGAALMKSYMYALSESDAKPSTLLFLNGGVKLTVEGSEVMESLKLLENAGVEILSCGTCLDFYGLKDKLAIGGVTNMYTIIEKMNGATNTIKL